MTDVSIETYSDVWIETYGYWSSDFVEDQDREARMTFDKEQHRQMIKELIAQMRLTPNSSVYRAVAELLEAIEAATISEPHQVERLHAVE